MAEDADLRTHQRTYSSFVKLLQYSLLGILAVVLFLWIVAL